MGLVGPRRTRRIVGLLAGLAWIAAACGGGLPGRTPDERAVAASHLGEVGADENVDVLVRAIESEPEVVQIAALQALGRIGTAKAVEALGRFLDHENRLVRIAVAQALQDVQDDAVKPRAAELLVKMGRAALPRSPADDPNLEVRRAVTTSLAVLKQKEGLDFLLDRAVNDYDENIRNAAVMTLGRLRDPRAVEALIAVYRSDNQKNRAWAIEALGKIGDPEALPTVRDALEDYDAVTRGKAAWALMQLEGEKAREPLTQALAREEDDLPAVVMAHCLALMGDRSAVAFLEDRTLRARSEIARAEAARILGEVGRRESMVVLDKAFFEDRDGLVKREAGLAIRKLRARFPREKSSETKDS